MTKLLSYLVELEASKSHLHSFNCPLMGYGFCGLALLNCSDIDSQMAVDIIVDDPYYKWGLYVKFQ
jgi:hypothetical protein